MANEQMLFPYQNTSRQFKEMEMQGIPVTMANLAIHRQKEEEMNQERMRYDQILQEAAAQQARKANIGKAREVVPDSEEEDSEELASSTSEECYAKLSSPSSNLSSMHQMVNVGELEVGMPNGCQECKMNVLGCSMARRKSRVSIELGVQRDGEKVRCLSPVFLLVVWMNPFESLRDGRRWQEAT
ncbi:hypothetical protein PIB30_024976 [Stylosanthes scabra]|uniref:Uncharacterized protein n=1 Tax=Stylosanthes scabra TaxID=79078 RepID=A0ABU6X7G3_9FABA|nr:hypothetical protein [Stylosanthes scabra]